MTLQTTGPLSLSDVMTELRIANPSRAYPISLGDADVLALAGKSAPPISLSDLYGKSSYVAMNGSVANVSDTAIINTSSNYTAHVPISIAFTGGKSPFSIAWAKVSGDGSVTNANASSTTADFLVVRFDSTGSTYTEVVQATVTDSTGATLVRQGTVTLTLE